MKTSVYATISLSAATLLSFVHHARAQEQVPVQNLISNGDFEGDKDTDHWPDDWGKLEHGAGYEIENGNHFFRLSYTKPDDTLIAYRIIGIPTGTSALQLSFRSRTSNLQVGGNAWFDARIMMNFKDAAGNKVEPSPGAPYFRESTKEWVTRTEKFLVPAGATALEFMPALFQVKGGTFDLDDIRLEPIDSKVLEMEAKGQQEREKFLNLAPEAPAPAQWPRALHVKEKQILDSIGKVVRLQGVNVESLEWTASGENVLRAAQVAVDGWKSNVIRLPVSSDFWFGQEAKDGGAAYHKRVEHVITLAANHGAYTLLDLHHFGAPRDRDVQFWKSAATQFKNNPTVLFDLFNEPHDTTWEVWRDGGFVPDKDAPADEDNFLSPSEKALNAKGYHAVGMQKLLDTVRDTGAKNPVVVGGLDWSYDLTGITKGFELNDRGGNGIIYATHIYPWKTGWENAIGAAMAKYPIIVGEVGASNKKMDWLPADQQEDAATWVPKMLGFIEKNQLSWTGFAFHPGSGPNMLTSWDFTPTPEWGVPAKRALAGEKFPYQGAR